MAKAEKNEAPWPEITQEERRSHEILFYSQGPLDGYLIGERARDLFLHSGLTLTVLSQIWNLADVSNDNLLNVDEFVLAVHLIQGILQGRPIPKALPENLTPNTSSLISLPPMLECEKEAYTKIFQSYDSDRKGSINCVDARELLQASKLSVEQLADIWDLSDVDRDGSLDVDEWTVACQLVRLLKKGQSLDGSVNPFTYLPDRISPTSLHARKNRVDQYEKQKLRLMSLKEKRKNQALRENERLDLLKKKSTLEKDLYNKLKSLGKCALSEEEFNKIVSQDADDIERLEEIVARLKKEHETVRQETVKVILGEQKLQVEVQGIKKETDELSKRLGTTHTKATKDPDPFHQLYEQRKEERKKSNLSEGEEPEIHLPFKTSPFDKDALKPVSGSDVFINPHVIDNNNTKTSSVDNSTIIENLHEFEDKLIETWSSPKARLSSTSGETMEGPSITKEMEEDRDEIFMIVKERDNWLRWSDEKSTETVDPALKMLQKKLIELKTEMQKLNSDVGGRMVFRNQSDYLARKKAKEEEEQQEKSKHPRRSKSSADPDYTAKRRSYVLEKRRDDVDYREKRLNRRSLNIDSGVSADREKTKSKAPDRPSRPPSLKTSDILSESQTFQERPRRRRLSNQEGKSEEISQNKSTNPESSPRKSVSPTTSPTRSTKKTRAPDPPVSPTSDQTVSPLKESKIPVFAAVKDTKTVPERPPRRKKKSSSDSEPNSPRPSSETEINETKTTSNDISVTIKKSEESSNTILSKGSNPDSDTVTIKNRNPDSDKVDVSVVIAPQPDKPVDIKNQLGNSVQNVDEELKNTREKIVNCDIKPRIEEKKQSCFVEKIESEIPDDVIVPVSRKLEKSLPTFEKLDKISSSNDEKPVIGHHQEEINTKEINNLDNSLASGQVNFLVESHDIELEEPIVVKPVDINEKRVDYDQNIVTNGDIDVGIAQRFTESNVSISDKNSETVDVDSNSNGFNDSLIKDEKDDISLLESIVQTLDFPENKSSHLLADKISLTPSLGSDTQSEAGSLPPLPDSEPPTLPLGAPPLIESEQVVEEEVIAVISPKPIETSLLSSNIFKSSHPVPESSSPKSNTVTNFRSNNKFGDLKMSEATVVEDVVPSVNGLDVYMNDLKIEAKLKQESTEIEEEDSDLSDIEGQNREFEATFTPGENGTGTLPTNATDDDDADGGIELISFNTTSTSIQSPGESQTDSAFEEMMSSMHSNDADGTNQLTLSNTLDDFQDSLVTENFESVKSSTEESEPPMISPPETPRMSYSYVSEKRPTSPPDPSKTPRDTTSIVKKAQQFSESLNRPPKVTIRASSEEMSEQRLQELDAERRAVINISKNRNVVMEMSESDEAVEIQECLITETTPSSGSIEVTKSTSWEDNSESKTPVKFTGKKINLEDKPEKVDLYGNNIIQENDTTESVDRESIANLASTRKQWENLLQASPKDTTQKPTPKKTSPVKHWEVKLPYKPVTSPEIETVPRSLSPEPRKMEEITSSNNYENESAIEREIRLANEREQMLRREQEERTELLKRQNASKQQINVEKFENNNNNSNEFKTMYHEMTEADRGSEMQKRETIIQRELNEQREREQAISHNSCEPEDADMPQSTESLIAREIRLQQEREKEISKQHKPTKEVSTEEETDNTEQTNGTELNYEEAIASNQHEGESLIARELRETREREEELRRQRERFSKTDISKEPEQVKAPVQEMPKKTVQSPPIQSVQSSRNFSTPPQSSSHVARNVKVAPISDSYEEEQEKPQPVKKSETPIEREIRLARERENELRQLKGLPLLEAPKEPVQEPVTPKSSEQEAHVYYKKPNPQSNSMKQYASSKLQKELMKQKERENAYRQEGRIVTTSEEHIDPVKYTDIAQINNDVPVKRNFVTRKSVTSLSDGEKTPSENGDIEPNKTVTLNPTTPQSSSKEPKFGRRSMPSAGGAVFSYKESSNKAESKIERELREMREREEELRQSRIGSGVASPNNPDSPREISQNSHLSLAAQWEQKYSK